MKILLFGAKGQVGQALRQHTSKTHEIRASESDITDSDRIENEINQFRPDVIINAAAYTHVDRAEIEKDRAFAVNSVAPALIATIAKRTGALLVHYSTDYVYDGAGYTPWVETDIPAPLNAYGATKLEGDTQIMMSGCDYLILRTSWVYSSTGDNFIRTLLKKSSAGETIKIVCDQIGAPTSAHFLARATYDMTEKTLKNKSLCGLYHVVPRGETSWYDYARLILGDKLVTPVLSNDVPQIAPRPLNSRLDTTKYKEAFDVIPPHWREDVMETILRIREDLEKNEND